MVRSLEMAWVELKRRLSGLVVVRHRSAHVAPMDIVECRDQGTIGGQQVTEERLNCVEVARHLGISTAIVDRWAATGRIPGAIAVNGTWALRMEDIVAITILGEPDDMSFTETE
jgi:hypothetical protein